MTPGNGSSPYMRLPVTGRSRGEPRFVVLDLPPAGGLICDETSRRHLMATLSIPDMSCGHCKASVEKAIHTLDPTAKVAVDLAARTVTIDSATPMAAVIAALDDVGFPAEATD
jgi:copper chaperone